MTLKCGLALCCAAAMVVLAWAPVAYVANGNGRSARARVVSVVEQAVRRASIVPAFQSTWTDPAVERVGLQHDARGGGAFQSTWTDPAVEEPGSASGAGVRGREPADPGQEPVHPPAAPALPGKPYAHMVQQAADRHGVDPRLVHALIEVESSYRADAVSAGGAMGLMQLMPITAKRYGVVDPLDPESNINAGTRHLRALLDEFGPLRALAAYNAGESVVRRHGGVPPYPQTYRFVRRVLGLFVAHESWGGDD